ncbi:MAG: response regulator transcription factor [Proteobacteria bacterium]|nr:response regulator transcription factor [Pseudomonadota bacterium]
MSLTMSIGQNYKAEIQTAMNSEKILLIEDDSDISELVQYNLEREGFKVFTSADGEEGYNLALQIRPELILLDLMLPSLDGLSLCRKLRAHADTNEIPIVMLTAKGEESDVVVGLEMGADDYVPKPFSPRELVARIRAVLRRPRAVAVTSSASDSRLTVGPITIDSERHEVFIKEQPLVLTLAEYRLLATLISRPGRVFTREQLLEKITGGETYVIDRNVDVHVRAIRKKMGDDAEFIVTVRGVGYKCRD